MSGTPDAPAVPAGPGPATLPAAVAAELCRTFSPPFADLSVIAVNAALMIAAWFLLPRAWLFSMTRPAAFPLVLALWMYADVPATNVLGADRERARQALDRLPTDDGRALGQLLLAKLTVLWLVVTPPCLVAGVATGLVDHLPQTTIATVLGILVLPVGPLRLAACVGVRWPYHVRPLRWRRERRQAWRTQVRWLLLASTPYVLVPFLCGVAAAPGIAVWRHTRPPTRQVVSEPEFLLLVSLACATSALMVVVGSLLARSIARRRRPKLVAYLADPDLG